jgi:hypothetical protein
VVSSFGTETWLQVGWQSNRILPETNNNVLILQCPAPLSVVYSWVLNNLFLTVILIAHLYLEAKLRMPFLRSVFMTWYLTEHVHNFTSHVMNHLHIMRMYGDVNNFTWRKKQALRGYGRLGCTRRHERAIARQCPLYKFLIDKLLLGSLQISQWWRSVVENKEVITRGYDEWEWRRWNILSHSSVTWRIASFTMLKQYSRLP